MNFDVLGTLLSADTLLLEDAYHPGAEQTPARQSQKSDGAGTLTPAAPASK